MTYTIQVNNIMEGIDYPTSGNILYSIIISKADIVDSIILDMTGVKLMPSVFLNTSIGRIISEKGVDFLKNKISFKNIRTSDVARLKDYVNRMTA